MQISKDWPPEKKEPAVRFEEKLEEYGIAELHEKQKVPSPEEFKALLEEMFSSNELFYDNYVKLATILNLSINEEDFIDDNDHLSDEQYEEKIKDELEPKIEQYLESILGSYGGGLSDKVKALKVLGSANSSATYFNNSVLKNSIVSKIESFLEQEKKSGGKYYLALHLEAALSGNEFVETGEIAPGRFAYKSYDNHCFVSKKEDHEKIKTLREEVARLEKRFALAEEKIKQDPEEGLKDLNVAEDSNMTVSKELMSYFSEEISSEYFVKQEMDHEKSDFIDHQFFLYKSVREGFNKKAGFSLSETTLPEQYNFFEYTKEFTNEEIEKVFEFFQKYKVAGFKTFLSLEHGGREMGDKILALGEKLPEGVAQKVFNKYGEIVEVSNLAEETLSSLLPKETFESSRGALSEIKSSLLVRAKNLLISYHDTKEVDEKTLIKELDRFKADILLFADTYRELKKSGEGVSLEDMKETQIISLTDEEREKYADELWEVSKSNREFMSSEELEKREARFRSTLEDQKIEFPTLRHKGEITAFCSMELDEEGNYYAESLNVEPEVKGSKLGSAFFPMVVKEFLDKGKGIVYGYVNAKNKGTLPYYESIGFVAEEVEKDGESFYKITINKESFKK